MPGRNVIPVFLGMCCILQLHCTAQHRPEAHRAKVLQEDQAARVLPPKLASDGTIPTKGDAVASSGNKQYDQFCASCHGATGLADSPAGMAMNPKPRNFHDAEWQDSVTDEHIANVIKLGGAGVEGVNASMPSWQAMLSDAQVDELVQLIRSWKSAD